MRLKHTFIRNLLLRSPFPENGGKQNSANSRDRKLAEDMQAR
jgi:hypothetical protein